MRITVNIYTVSTIDNAPVETSLFEDVSGYIEVDKRVFKENRNSMDILALYCFIPDKLYDGILRGYIMKLGSTTYKIVDVLNHDTHNEIYCRRRD